MNRALISCSCGSSPTYARTQFKIKFPDEPEPPMYIAKKGYSLLEKLPPNSEHHVPNYMAVPVYRGNKAKDYVASYELADIAEYIKRRSAFVIILGEDGEDIDWVDINNAKLTQELKAKAILERFL